MKTFNIKLIAIATIMSASLAACSDDAEELTPSEVTYHNLFAPDPADKSKSAELRRRFYDDTGIYILFSEKLGKYTNSAGIEKEEYVDFNFNLTTSNGLNYKIEELPEEDIEKNLRMIEKYFVPYINIDGGKLRPYSMLLALNLQTISYGKIKNPAYLSTERCFAINMNSWQDVDEDESKTMGKALLRSLIDDKVTQDSPELDPFFAVCAECYDAYYISEIEPDWVYDQDPEIVYNLGFTTYYEDFWGDGVEYDEFPNKKSDLKLFKNEIFDKTEEQFLADWGNYPKIVEKYHILKECIEKMGVDFNAVK